MRRSTGKDRRRSIRKHLLRCALTGALLFVCVSGHAGSHIAPVISARADEYTNDLIRQKESEISSTKQERDQLKSGLTDVQKVKASLEKNKADLNAYVSELDTNLTALQNSIDMLTEKIAEKEAEIEQTILELAAAEAERDAQYEAMKQRIKYIYLHGDTIYLEILLGEGSFADKLNRSAYVEKLEEYDRNMLENYKLQVRLVEVTKEALEEERITLDETKADLEEEEAAVETLIAEKQAQIGAIQQDINTQEVSIQQYQQAIAQRDSEIAALEAAVKAERERLAEENRRHFGGGPFTWPAPSYTYISSDYGYRTAPTSGASTFHSGLDMAAPAGSPILAAAEGTVIAAGYSWSMGNYVMIDHGDGISTVYMHASALYVSKGQDVSAGQKIAAVGSTGISTGPHLHFSVRVNGSYVNPRNYL